MIHIPPDWALATTHIASEYVSRQFLALIGGRPNAIPPLELDFVMLAACSKLASTLADAYRNPVTINFDVARYADVLQMMEKGINPAREDSLLSRYPPDSQIHLDWPTVVCDKFGIIVLWYLPGAIDLAIQDDMAAATAIMSVPLARSVTSGAATNNQWRTHSSNFYPSQCGGTPGCINLSPAWFLQGHPAPKFHLHVSATLKLFDGWSFCQAMQRPAALITAALRVMHPNLYWSSLAMKLALGLWAADNKLDEMGDYLREWASVFTALAIVCNRRSPMHHDPLSRPQWFDVMTTFGNYGVARMKMPNLGIESVYPAGSMVAGSGRIMRHGLDMADGDRTAWVLYMRDDVHEFVDIPRADYSKYRSLVTDAQ
ncbi:uncharacterized protein HD556DRAFT_1444554 [Suillus plorans]|uniref:2OGFeDO JBP1/TET oxygenase domain-containing protein n=1 Tax=Suillus plorans TaxID=116603 RepID=A0A9P7DFN5_9AGAM|nr:uncharacterized protein HD556DRAFT_1444554 [Suillus plorans]KAG1792285.1 hypothetical protein HD556DRAFT_1444554 [Suillus plorans]